MGSKKETLRGNWEGTTGRASATVNEYNTVQLLQSSTHITTDPHKRNIYLHTIRYRT